MSVIVLVLFMISLGFGAMVFVRLIGPDAWLIKGLRGDRPGAIVAFCTIVLCGVVIFLGLRFSLSLLPDLLSSRRAGVEPDSAAEYAYGAQVVNGIVWLLSLCVPILTGYLLGVLYRSVYRICRRLALR